MTTHLHQPPHQHSHTSYNPYHPYTIPNHTHTHTQTKKQRSRSNRRQRQHPTHSSSSSSKSSNSNRCFTWLLLPRQSNTHIAKNRSSFSSYRRAPCKIANQRVLGVGTVQLRVQRAPDDPRTNTLVLHDVLHMPNARCNGISVAKYTGESEEETASEGGSSAGERAVVEEAENGGVVKVKSEREDGEGLWFARGRNSNNEGGDDGLRVVLAGERKDDDGAGGEGDGKGIMGVVASKEELEMLNERVRNRSWV
ncbi:hypothetical protein BO83DRAFT_433345 [Aspergillus eucalypticola CBS 122712]|uniref:Retrovirus-related Pol polyprotein from transposon TNT 1-94-like beta-barrel domain-containing protein n=1 Tax=Aspergillus eucalypticola (strain CBS 122712 / IBT 29274) TaxID=1448314 RepID=A0A317WGG7_ASPEC|nr:uncharacterized protein BO83DRAFT_433345 [Aspergillus eucalypticola CBS 122712]PWY85399.1 hypothetical protein BO83DRAFT_433345 [Aspergillus eucalypticola CBS 122712]